MRIKGIEFGLVRDHQGNIIFDKRYSDVCAAGCRIYTFLCFYFTILAQACRDLSDKPNIKDSNIDRAADLRAKAVSKSEMRRINVLLDRPIEEGVSQLKKMTPAQIKRGRKLVKKLAKSNKSKKRGK